MVLKILNDIIKKYQDGESLRSLGLEYDLDPRTVKKRLIENNIPIRERYAGKINNYFSEIITPTQSYILGWIVSDGHLNKKIARLEIHLQKLDLERIIFFSKNIPNSKIYQYPDGSYKIYVDSKQLINDLVELGIPRGKKSNNVLPLQLYPELMGYFWAGIFDGDGTIWCPSENNVRFGISGNYHICNGFKKYMNWDTKVAVKKPKKDNHNYSYQISKTYSNLIEFKMNFGKLFTPFSLENKLFLNRKQERANNFINKWT